MLERNWKVKDNLIIAINCFNKKYVLEHKEVMPNSLLRLERLYILTLKYAKKHSVDIVEASDTIKIFVKNNKNLSKISLQNAISLL